MYLAFDTETSGLDPTKHNLLTACFIVLNDNLVEIDRLNLNIKYNEYNITIKAMEINKIDLIKHHNCSSSVDLKTARSLLLDFLKKNKRMLLKKLRKIKVRERERAKETQRREI